MHIWNYYLLILTMRFSTYASFHYSNPLDNMIFHSVIFHNIILDRHHAWRSLDPTLDIWSNFVKKKSILPPFFLLHLFLFKKTQFLVKIHHLFCIGLSTRVICPVYPPGLSAQVICRGYPPRLFIQLSDASQSD